jgi:hypothetical protein
VCTVDAITVRNTKKTTKNCVCALRTGNSGDLKRGLESPQNVIRMQSNDSFAAFREIYRAAHFWLKKCRPFVRNWNAWCKRFVFNTLSFSRATKNDELKTLVVACLILSKTKQTEIESRFVFECG